VKHRHGDLEAGHLLGGRRVSKYKTDIKFVEVGIVPLVLLGLALYPVLSAVASAPATAFAALARDFCRVQLMLSGWLAVGMILLIPLLIVPLFGPRFEPATVLLPWFALLAIVKGAEVALYRLLYSVQRQAVYFRSLAIGTVVIVGLNLVLIPRLGVSGAVQAAVLSTCGVVSICAAGLAQFVRWRVFIELLARLAVALALTWGVSTLAAALGAVPWLSAGLSCCLFPDAAALAGLVPNPSRSLLLGRNHPAVAS